MPKKLDLTGNLEQYIINHSEDLSDVQVGAKKSELKKAFGKMSSGRKNQRPLLNKFIGMIA